MRQPFIVAHHYQRAKFVADQLGFFPNEWRYVSGPESLRGYRGPTVYVVEDFETIPNWDEVRQQLMCVDPFIIIFKEDRRGKRT